MLNKLEHSEQLKRELRHREYVSVVYGRTDIFY